MHARRIPGCRPLLSSEVPDTMIEVTSNGEPYWLGWATVEGYGWDFWALPRAWDT